MLRLVPSSHAVVFPSMAMACSRLGRLPPGGGINHNADCSSGRLLRRHRIRERDSDRSCRCYSAASSSELRREERAELECLVRASGWEVRRLDVENGDEMRQVARVQAEAFHEPAALFDDIFFLFFEAEVLAGLLYKLRNSPPDRYACLVAQPAASEEQQRELVGAVDVTVLRDGDVVRHLQGGEEYLYVSGIAVSESFRRQKVATTLLEACNVLSSRWGYRYLALRAYEDDHGAQKLYANAGYEVVGGDPVWVALMGKKRRVLMIKKI